MNVARAKTQILLAAFGSFTVAMAIVSGCGTGGSSNGAGTTGLPNVGRQALSTNEFTPIHLQRSGRARVDYIGSGDTSMDDYLAFETNQSLKILIKGTNLSALHAAVTGTKPIETNDYGIILLKDDTNSEVALLEVKSTYTGRLVNDDRITVQLTPVQPLSTEAIKKGAHDYSTRTFVLVSSDYYRTNISRRPNCADPKPHIYSIGTQNIITYQRDHELVITFEGRDLWCKQCLLAGAVTGTYPAKEDAEWDFDRTDIGSDIGAIVLKTNYVNRLQNGAQITVQLVLMKTNKRTPSLLATNDFDAFALRTFTAYESEYFRTNVLAKRFPPQNVTAFPLPQKEAIYLFGPLVAENYFAVELSIRGIDQDKLISSGMIVASGRAIVCTNRTGKISKEVGPTGDPIDGAKLFTVPIQVSPRSAVQVYTVLDDLEAYTKRATVFRELEFVGALGSAFASAYGGHDLIKGIGLFTGVVIPESKKLWHDPWPGYKRNLVTFGMPDLLKIPKNTVAGHKYIFFPKRELDNIISDQTLYAMQSIAKFNKDPFPAGHNPTKSEVSRPLVNIISLAFDNLEIPYEDVFSPGELDPFFRINEITRGLSTEIQSRSVLDEQVGNTNFFYEPTITRDGLTNLLAKLTVLSAKADTLTNADDFPAAVSNLYLMAVAFTNRQYAQALIDDPEIGLDGLRAKDRVLGSIQKDLLKGKEPGSVGVMLDKIANATRLAADAKNFYDEVAKLLGSDSTLKLVTALINNVNDSQKQTELIRAVKVPTQYGEQLDFAKKLRGTYNKAIIAIPPVDFKWYPAVITNTFSLNQSSNYTFGDVRPVPVLTATNVAFTNSTVSIRFFTATSSGTNSLYEYMPTTFPIESNRLQFDFAAGIWPKLTNSIAAWLSNNTTVANFDIDGYATVLSTNSNATNSAKSGVLRIQFEKK